MVFSTRPSLLAHHLVDHTMASQIGGSEVGPRQRGNGSEEREMWDTHDPETHSPSRGIYVTSRKEKNGENKGTIGYANQAETNVTADTTAEEVGLFKPPPKQ